MSIFVLNKTYIVTIMFESISAYFIATYMVFFVFFGLKLKTEHDFSDLVCIRDALKIKYRKLSINVADTKHFFNVTITTKHPGK